MRRLTTPQRVLLLAGLIIGWFIGNWLWPAVGIAKGQKEEKMGYMPDGQTGEVHNVIVGEVAYDELQRDAALWREHLKRSKEFETNEESYDDWVDIVQAASHWREHEGNIWRLYVHLVGTHITHSAAPNVELDLMHTSWTEPNGDHVNGVEHLARAIVRAARDNGLPLNVLVALVMQETQQSPFSNNLIGSSGERTMVQINPLDGDPSRAKAIAEGLADPAKAIEWAGRYLAARYKDGDLDVALRRYNGGPGGMDSKSAHRYADDILTRGTEMVKADALWGLVPE